MGLPFPSAGLSQHQYVRVEYLICWPRSHKCQMGSRNPLCKGSTISTWSLDPLVLPHIASPRSCQPDKATGWPFEGIIEMPSWTQHSVGMGHSLQDVTHTLNQCTLHSAESPWNIQFGGGMAENRSGMRRSSCNWSYLPSLTMIHLWEFVVLGPELCKFRDPGSQRRKISTRWHSKNHIKL